MKTKNNIWGENVKKLKCKSCLNIWYVDDYRLNDQKYCPCCCAKITKEVSLGEIDTPPKAIYDYIMQYGIDELKNPESLVNYLNDMCPDMKKEIRLLSRAFRDYRHEIFKLFKAELSETDNLLNSLKDDLINYDEMSEQGASIICENLNGAVMLYNGKNLPVVMSVEVSDILDISEETETLEEQPEEKAYSQSEIIDRGKCGDNAEWTFYRDGTLIISGSGDMYDYTYDSGMIKVGVVEEHPVNTDWYKYKDTITKIAIEKGITKIGNFSFLYCGNVTNITISDSVTIIGALTFGECNSLTNITIPNGAIIIGEWAFFGCSSLKKINISPKARMNKWQENWKGDCNAKIVYI